MRVDGSGIRSNRSALRPVSFLGAAALALVLVFGIGLGSAQAGQATLAWDPNTEPELAGYKVYYGTAAGTYGTPIDVGNVTTYTVPGLTDGAT